MSRKLQLVKAIQKNFKQISKQFLSTINKQIIWLLRVFFGNRRRRSSENAGFLLPTVAMVILVVVLLTTAILFRSFERSKNASNVRVNEAVLNAASPALDRARAKLDKLFDDRRLPRATPSDTALETTLKTYLNEYSFGDETQLNVNYGSETALPTAWMFPIDTNNNGKFDTYTLYGIYFRNPPITGGSYSRARNPLEARTPPMTSGSISNGCQDTLGTSATLVGSTGWFNIAGKLKKSFFVYTANVPITSLPTTDTDKYETFQGNKGFSGLEYQQDRIQLPLVNNAVVYDDDVELTPGTAFNLNGRILTNSNFLTGSNGNTVTLYQVSSKNSCFYDDENAKIVVGGNLGAGLFTSDTDDASNTTVVHLFQGLGADPNTSSGVNVKDNKSVAGTSNRLAYNSLAYVQRINLLVQAQAANATDPQEVIDGITQQLKVLNLTTATASTDLQASIRNNQLGLYFKKRTRRVPYAEIAFGGNAVGTYISTTVLQGSGNSLRPPDTWVYPFDPTDGKTRTNYANLALKANTSDSTKLLPGATEPTQQRQVGKEQYLGDRILLGNNLPALWWNGTTFIGSDSADTQNITGINWDDPSTANRTRRSRVQQLADLGTVERDGDWESSAATVPSTPQDSVGGLRVVTGAGIYLPSNLIVSSSQADFTAAATQIWSDMMPVPSETATVGTSVDARDIAGGFDYSTIQVSSQPYLRMRATAVYHYQASGYSQTSPTPIACISSYYDPTNTTTAHNLNSLPSATGFMYDKAANGLSNNGIVYPAPTKTVSDYQYLLNYDASLKYLNGRTVNEVLKNSLAKAASSRTLSEQSAIDSAICAIQILDGTLSPSTTPVIPHGAIYETTFLDARQIKAIHKDASASNPGLETFTNSDGVNGDGTAPFANVTTPDYELAKETRQPLEIRTTVLDISKLRTTTYGTATPQEYLIPNSGIIYATRDDALLDLSASSSSGKDAQKSSSPVDFKLDPTRRPNAIMLINGNPIWRTSDYRDGEKGLILASNLPVYIKGDFNIHTQEEFTTSLASDWNNFYSRTASTRNTQFACRKNDTRLPGKCLPNGDAWRPASVLSDAITLLSNNFQFGYRSDGDYDLNNNLGDSTSITAFRKNGFALINRSGIVVTTNNANVINAAWYDTSTAAPSSTSIKSSYLNNFVTPIQRVKNTTTSSDNNQALVTAPVAVPEYLMEYCPKLPVSACTDPTNDWVIAPAITGSSAIGLPFSVTTYKAGTSAQLPVDPNNKRYPRRVAFKRDSAGNVLLDHSKPIILGIKGGLIKDFPIYNFANSADDRPDQKINGLWFRTTTANDDTKPLQVTLGTGLTDQPILSPVLQIQAAFDREDVSPTSDRDRRIGPNNRQGSYWLQWATATTFNLAAAGGDTPARTTEDNGGLHNFVRFLENWDPLFDDLTKANAATISGSFIQRTRSVYATAPFVAFLTNSPSITSDTVYPIANSNGQIPFYLAPKRQWGYDVALLSQSPDAFSQKLAITPDDKPNEYFREVGRDDAWVQALLCAKKASDSNFVVDGDQRPSCS
ncbi:hormogonium polysaccharide biosynthesis protein HpsA [Nostoc sp.]|uniref:hormogonium polysaccharide biosynthesis protein HpsA n=1 Tax=Nostoc sp. TaxID=1180 RepID=UPI002FF97BD2